jgi:hypothetical protein
MTSVCSLISIQERVTTRERAQSQLWSVLCSSSEGLPASFIEDSSGSDSSFKGRMEEGMKEMCREKIQV